MARLQRTFGGMDRQAAHGYDIPGIGAADLDRGPGDVSSDVAGNDPPQATRAAEGQQRSVIMTAIVDMQA